MNYSQLSIKLFGGSAKRLKPHFEGLRKSLRQARIRILLKTYLSMLLFTTCIAFAGTAGLLAFFFTLWLNFPLQAAIFFSITGGASSAFATLLLGWIWPKQQASSRASDIDANLPFGINHLAAIAEARVPAYTLFKLIATFGEYGELGEEARRIVRGVDTFGQSIVTSIRSVAETTPSKKLASLLSEMTSVIGAGGSLEDFLREQSDRAMFDYGLARRKYQQSLSTYADLYTAILIVAPLFLIALLAIMGMIGGKVFGLSIQDAMNYGIYLAIPLANAGFILFIHATQPKIV